MENDCLNRLQKVKEKYAHVVSSLDMIQAGHPEVVGFVLLDHFCETLGFELRHALEDWKHLQEKKDE